MDVFIKALRFLKYFCMRIWQKFNYKPYFIWVFPIVFYLMQFALLGQYLSWGEMAPRFLLHLSVQYLIIAILFFILKKLCTKNFNTALICLYLFLILYFFYKPILIFISTIPVIRYGANTLILVPGVLLTLVILYKYTWNAKKWNTQLFQYFNALSLLFIVMQSVLLIKSLSTNRLQSYKAIEFSKSKSTFDNNIYFILLDGYPGAKSLQKFFNYNNNGLIDHLKNNGFYVHDSITSNYNKTINSINSILNLQYINYHALYPWDDYNTNNLNSYKAIHSNNLFKFLKTQNYKIENNSFFEVENAKTPVNSTMDVKGFDLLHAPLMHNVAWNSLLWQLSYGKFRTPYFYKKVILKVFYNNMDIIDQTASFGKLNPKKKQFVYSHLLMPHKPYFTDSVGNLLDTIKDDNVTDHNQFLNYLKFSNTKIKALTDSIRINDPNAMVILLSDHGYRNYPDYRNPFMFNNFLAIHTPDSNYNQIAKIKSNVNFFRVILNQYFGQSLPILKDSFMCFDGNTCTFSSIQIK
jgi:hypothetical protein